MSESLDLGLTLGAMEIGTMISSVLLGVTTVQLYIYYTKDYQDPLWLRSFVCDFPSSSDCSCVSSQASGFAHLVCMSSFRFFSSQHLKMTVQVARNYTHTTQLGISLSPDGH